MPVIVKPQAGRSGTVIPDGVYEAELSDVREFENAFGERIGFEFTIQGGEHDGATVMRSTGTNCTPKSKLAEMVYSLVGDEAENATQGGLDLEQLKGQRCRVLIAQGQSKSGQTYSNVEKVIR